VDEKHTILLVSTIIADLIVTVGWAVAVFFAVRQLNAKVRATTVPEARDPSRPLLYAVSVLFWPAALALGMARLGKPDSVRSARVMLCIALGQFSLALLVAIGIVTTVAVYPPRVLLDLLP
jgi:hypothetical protein